MRIDQLMFPGNGKGPRNISEWVSATDVNVTYCKGDDKV